MQTFSLTTHFTFAQKKKQKNKWYIPSFKEKERGTISNDGLKYFERLTVETLTLNNTLFKHANTHETTQGSIKVIDHPIYTPAFIHSGEAKVFFNRETMVTVHYIDLSSIHQSQNPGLRRL